MNKSKRSMPAQLRKKMKKELRASALQPEPVLKSDRITPAALLSRRPVKVRKKDESLFNGFKKKFEVKKVKKGQSKRTNSGMVVEKSPPAIVHVEGRRWIKTIEKQNVAKKKIMTRHMTKKK